MTTDNHRNIQITMNIDHLLDCDYYTRPEFFKGVGIPEILRSGDHEKIADWRQQQRELITARERPDLFEKYKDENKNK